MRCGTDEKVTDVVSLTLAVMLNPDLITGSDVVLDLWWEERMDSRNLSDAKYMQKDHDLLCNMHLTGVQCLQLLDQT
jgi:hypothetical protein